MKKIDIPVVVVGPGTQPESGDGVVMEAPPSPGEMSTYVMPDLSMLESLEKSGRGMALLRETRAILDRYRIGQKPQAQVLDGLDADNRKLVDQVLGNGEVSIVYDGDVHMQIQESVLAGVWRIQHIDQSGQIVKDILEVAEIPAVVRESTFINTRMPVVDRPQDLPQGVLNAPPVIIEICDKVKDFKLTDEPYVINLTLLPQTEEDLAYINDKLGVGPVTILSRGYGNCRITSTATPNVWWVQYFNSDDINILKTCFNIGQVPDRTYCGIKV